MATEELVYEPSFRMSWGAIIGGAIVTLGVWLLLHTLGLAAGLTAIDPDKPGSLRSIGLGTGIWSIVAPLLALFAGGLVTGRCAGAVDRTTGAIHGMVMWALTAVAGVAMVAMVVGTVVSVGARAGAAVVKGAAGAAGMAGVAGEKLGVDVDDVLGPINQRLQAQGMPPVTSEQIVAVTRDAATRAVREGHVDRGLLLTAITQNTELDRADAERLAATIETQWNEQIAEAAGAARHDALKAAESAGKALWGVFAALLLGLISAAAGALVGVSRRPHLVAEVVQPRPAGPPEGRYVPVPPRP